MTSNIPRINGIGMSGAGSQTVFENGQYRQASVKPGESGGNGTIILPGEMNIGEQVRFMPASTEIADMLSGAGSAMQGINSLWDSIEQKVSRDNLKELRRNYLSKSSEGHDAATMEDWFESQGFQPDEYNRDAYAEFRAGVKGLSRDQWENEDLIDQQIKLSTQIAHDPIKMNTVGQQMYLTDAVKKSGNKRFVAWAREKYAGLNYKRAEDSAQVVRLSQAQQWQDNISKQMSNNPGGAHVLASHPESSRLGMLIATGGVEWDPDNMAFRNTLNNQLITPTTTKEELQAALAVNNGGIADDPATLSMLMGTTSDLMNRSRNIVTETDAKLRLQASAQADKNAAYLDTDTYVGIKLNSPEFDTLVEVPGMSDKQRQDQRLVRDTVLSDFIRQRTGAVLDRYSNMPMQARIDKAREAVTIPHQPQFAHLLMGTKEGNVVPNERGKDLLASLNRDLDNQVYKSVTETYQQQAENTALVAKSGSPNALAIAMQLNNDTVAAVRAITGTEPTITDGIVNFPTDIDMSTVRGESLHLTKEAYMKGMTEINKNGMIWQTLANPRAASLGDVNGIIDNMITNESHYVAQIKEARQSGENLPALFYASEQLGSLQISHGVTAEPSPKFIDFAVDQFSDENDPVKIMAGAALMSSIQGSEAYNKVVARMTPKQHMIALAALDGYAVEAMKKTAESLVPVLTSNDPEVRKTGKALADKLVMDFISPVRELMSGLSDTDAGTIIAVAQKMPILGDPQAAKREDPNVQRFYNSVMPQVIRAAGNSGLSLFSDNPQMSLEILSQSPTTRPLVEELLARTYVYSQKTPDSPITDTEWSQIFQATFGGGQAFYMRGSTPERLIDPGRNFAEDIVDRLRGSFNRFESDLGPVAFPKMKALKETLADVIQSRSSKYVELTNFDSIDKYAEEYAKTVVDWAPGRHAKLVLASHGEIQSQLMDTLNPGVPLAIEIYDGDTWSRTIPILGRAGGNALVVSRHIAPFSEPIKETETGTESQYWRFQNRDIRW